MKTPETQKAVDYCYPSSPDAVKYGHGNDGCYVVALVDSNYNATVTSVHTSKESAFLKAARLPQAWHPIWAKWDAEFIAKAEASCKAFPL